VGVLRPNVPPKAARRAFVQQSPDGSTRASYGSVMARRLLACALVSAAVGCGGVTAAEPRDASTDAMVTADAHVVIDATAAPPPLTDASSEEGASAFEDVSPLPPFDASLPALPSCDADGYFVTINDGAGSWVLDDGCGDAGAWAVPALVPYSCGNLCGFSEVEVCGGGLSLELQQYYPPTYGSSGVSGSIFARFIGGSGDLLVGAGTFEFGAPPYVTGAYGTTLGGSYTVTLKTAEGEQVGAMAGTFCVFDAF
jgi:hypothetical protein